jgi:RNA polymerase sigma-70 factor (ECF subfamily)
MKDDSSGPSTGDRSEDRTSASLLMRLAQSPPDESAWDDFMQKYGEQIYRWCRHWGLQDADARDVTQRVMVDLARQMPDFSYDRSKRFRAWLKTIAHRHWGKYVAALQRPGQGTGDSYVGSLLDSVEARDDLARRLDKEYDLELLGAAMGAVRERVQPATWEAFRRLALEHQSGEEAAAALGMSVEAAFKARSNFTKLLREEMKKLE